MLPTSSPERGFSICVGIPASDALRAPFVLGDRRALETLVTGAELEAVEVATRKGTARFPSVRVMVEADLRGWLPVMGVVLTQEQIVDVLQAAEEVSPLNFGVT